MDRRLQELYRKEERWDRIETLLHVIVFLIALGIVAVIYALTDIDTYPQYEPGIRYELPLNLE